MKTRTFEIRTSGVRGLPAVLLGGLLLLIIAGLVALVLLAGAALLTVGVAVSAVAAIYYAVRRRLSGGVKPSAEWLAEDRPASAPALETRDIDVEVLPRQDR